MPPVCTRNRTPQPFDQACARNLSSSSLACRALPDVLAGNAQLLSLDVHDNALTALPSAWADTSSSLAALPLTYCDISMNRIQVRSWAPGRMVGPRRHAAFITNLAELHASAPADVLIALDT